MAVQPVQKLRVAHLSAAEPSVWLVFQEREAAVELQFVLVLAVLEERWAGFVFSPPWGATGPAAGKAC